MSILSIEFWLLVSVGCILYYLLPKKTQWVVLLVLSMGFYLSYGLKMIGFIVFTSLFAFGAAILIENTDLKKDALLKANGPSGPLSKEEKKAIRKEYRKKQSRILVFALIAVVGVWAFMKYAAFVAESIMTLFGKSAQEGGFLSGIILPLGISFYTLQITGYLVDVCWGKVKACRNPFKFLLFVSFFPQLIQGPIQRFDKLGAQFDTPHAFDIERIEKGAVLIFWGLMKKLVIANRAVLIVNEVFDKPGDYGGLGIVFGLLIYSAQQYADFSGGIDIVTGISEVFGIQIAENFRRPYFSRSLAEFWRRWHISLGAFARDYIFYPLALSKPFKGISERLTRRYGSGWTEKIPLALSNIIVFVLVGLWHGAKWHCIFWGLYNGLILAAGEISKGRREARERAARSEMDNPQLQAATPLEDSKRLEIFRIIRTFAIVNFGWFFDRSETMSGAFTMIRKLFSGGPSVGALIHNANLTSLQAAVMFFGILVLFAVSLIQEKKKDSVRNILWNKPLVFRWIVLYALIFGVILLAYSSNGLGEFIYAQF